MFHYTAAVNQKRWNSTDSGADMEKDYVVRRMTVSNHDRYAVFKSIKLTNRVDSIIIQNRYYTDTPWPFGIIDHSCNII